MRAARRRFGRVQTASLNGSADAVLATAAAKGMFPARAAPGETALLAAPNSVAIQEATSILSEALTAACREHGAALPEQAEDMAAVVEDHPYFTSFGLRRNPKYRKRDKHEMFRQAVEDAVASVLCQEIEPQTEEGASTSG